MTTSPAQQYSNRCRHYKRRREAIVREATAAVIVAVGLGVVHDVMKSVFKRDVGVEP